LIKSKSGDRIVYFIHGGIDVKKREEMIQTLITNKNVIIVASYQTLSTGINAPRIENIILASPSKSKIRILQSIGRSLRLAKNKSGATIYDIGDNLKINKKDFNYSLKHFIERIRLYSSEEFNYKLINTKLPTV
jgi:superfamily II DNA or RNA helicase